MKKKKLKKLLKFSQIRNSSLESQLRSLHEAFKFYYGKPFSAVQSEWIRKKQIGILFDSASLFSFMSKKKVALTDIS